MKEYLATTVENDIMLLPEIISIIISQLLSIDNGNSND